MKVTEQKLIYIISWDILVSSGFNHKSIPHMLRGFGFRIHNVLNLKYYYPIISIAYYRYNKEKHYSSINEDKLMIFMLKYPDAITKKYTFETTKCKNIFNNVFINHRLIDLF